MFVFNFSFTCYLFFKKNLTEKKKCKTWLSLGFESIKEILKKKILKKIIFSYIVLL